MTPRQREFCRHYLRGLSAARAARAAGYSASTAEKNAATILSCQSVSRYLARHRKAAQIVTVEDLLEVRDRMKQALRSEDDKAAALAGHALIRLCRMAGELASQQAGCSHPQDTQKQTAQPPDHQIEEPAEKLPESDTLETGQNAFDLRLSPLKAEVAKPKTPIHITLKTLKKKKKAARTTLAPPPPPNPL